MVYTVRMFTRLIGAGRSLGKRIDRLMPTRYSFRSKSADSDILINEATFSNDLEVLAIDNRHCSTRQVLELAQRMRAKNTVLTHFSNRYARIPQLLDLRDASNTIVAFDNMWIRPSLLDKLANMIEPLSRIYEEKLIRIRRKDLDQTSNKRRKYSQLSISATFRDCPRAKIEVKKECYRSRNLNSEPKRSGDKLTDNRRRDNGRSPARPGASPGTKTKAVTTMGFLVPRREDESDVSKSLYLFNVGEGSRRLFQELKLKLQRVRSIFITQESWEKVSGLYGVAMALRDHGVMDVNIYGPSDLHYLFDDAGGFVRLNGMSVIGHECKAGESFEDEAIKVLFAPITSASNARAVCYVVLPKERRPKLDPQRCEQLNVPKGPMYGILKGGGEVTVDGKVISSSDVTAPSEQPLVLLLIDAPSEDFVPALQESTLLSQYSNASVVIHFTPLAVMREPAYMRWMRERLQPTAAHLLVNEAAVYGSGGTATLQQMFLHELVPQAFPLLRIPSVAQTDSTGDRGGAQPSERSRNGFNNVIPPPAAHENWRQDFHGVQNLVAAQPLMEYRLKPPSRFNILRCPLLDLTEESSKIREKIDQVRPLVQSLQNSAREKGGDPYPSLLFTGTGGAVPSPMRNTAGILVNFSKSQSILLDCAEGTLGQLIRLLGPQETSRVLSTIKAIFISHPHADHTLGLPALLKARSEAGHSVSKLNLIAPVQTNRWLSSCESRGFLRANTCQKYNSRYMYNDISLSELLGVSEAQMDRMDHCPDAYGIAMKTYIEKITYSGDTAPNDGLVRIGKESDILINEATLGTVLPNLARNKRHCTTQQALDLAERMKARNTVLTHFSTRYARIPQLLDLEGAKNTIIAFDNMWVLPSLLSALSNMIRPLSEIYREKLQGIRRKERRQH